MPRRANALILPTALLAAAAHADVRTARWDGSSSFEWNLWHQNDFDQGRASCSGGTVPGLPNDGRMFCAPTANADCLAYVASHGYPGVAPGPQADWSAAYNYAPITTLLNALGNEMSTDPAAGTSFVYAWAAVRDRLASQSDGAITLYAVSNTATWAPTVPFVAKRLIKHDGICIATIAAYELTGYSTFGYPELQRVAGHVVAPVYATVRSGGEYSIAFNDPGLSDYTDDWCSQSAFFSSTYRAADGWVHVLDETGGWLFLSKVSVVYGHYMDDRGDATLLDGFMAYEPRSGYGWQPETDITGQPTGNGTVSTWHDRILAGFQQPYLRQQIVPNDGEVVDFAPDPLDPSGIISLRKLPGSPTAVERIDLDSGERTQFLPGAFNDPKRFVITRDFAMVASEPGGVARRLLAQPQVATARTQLGFTPAALAASDATDELIALNMDARTLVRLPAALNGPPVTQPLPANLAIAGNAWIFAAPDGATWICSELSPAIHRVTPQGTETIAIPGYQGGATIEVDDVGAVFIAAKMQGEPAGRWLKIRKGPQGWVRDRTTQFADRIVGRMAHIGRSRSNLTPGRHSAPFWKDLPITGQEHGPCRGDLNVDRAVDGADLGILLSMWGPIGAGLPNGSYDLDHSGMVDGGDLGILLSAWGPCH